MSRANILLFYLFVSVLAVFPDAKCSLFDVIYWFIIFLPLWM